MLEVLDGMPELRDQISYVEDKGDHYLYYIDRCPVCWGRQNDRPICYVATGLLQEGLRWVSGGRMYRVDEIECVATGGKTCLFKIDKEPVA